MNDFRQIVYFSAGGVAVVFAAAVMQGLGLISDATTITVAISVGGNMVTAAIARWTDRKTTPNGNGTRPRDTGAYASLETFASPGKEKT